MALLLAAASLVIGGCASRQLAPVIERAPGAQAPAVPAAPAAAVDPRPETYAVKRGETLYGIALDHGLDYRELAEWNGISNLNLIRVGDVLRLRAPAVAAASEGAAQVKPVTSAGALESRPLGAGPGAASAATKPDEATIARIEPRRPEPKPEALPPGPRPEAQSDDDEKVEWAWPASGRVIGKFSAPINKGIDIAVRSGSPVYAAASGVVRYTGSGIPSLGKLIVIRHNKTYISAYAHNRDILVKENQSVVKGQKIGEIGEAGTDTPKLHFEIRRLGNPIDPMKFLPERPS